MATLLKPEDVPPEWAAYLRFRRTAVEPAWMRYPEAWMWRRPGQPGLQGFGANWRDCPGLANLLWLAMDMDMPPPVYEGRNNPSYMAVVCYATTALAPLVALAGQLDLRAFSGRLPAAAKAAGCVAWGEDMLMKAMRRLEHAHT